MITGTDVFGWVIIAVNLVMLALLFTRNRAAQRLLTELKATNEQAKAAVAEAELYRDSARAKRAAGLDLPEGAVVTEIEPEVELPEGDPVTPILAGVITSLALELVALLEKAGTELAEAGADRTVQYMASVHLAHTVMHEAGIRYSRTKPEGEDMPTVPGFSMSFIGHMLTQAMQTAARKEEGITTH